ncbi:MAG: Rieske 2Fe-2S domain-containing protein [Gemmatimonadaceae bacterium]
MSETDAPTEAAGGAGTQHDLLEEVDGLISALAAHSDPAVREQTAALLANIDAVHRTALTHLMGAIRSMGGDAFLNRLSADPAIRLLLMSYDLLAVDRRLLAEEALDTVRGHLHGHGVDIELADCVGGVVYVRLHGVERSAVAPEAAARDIEAALLDGLPGFQELVLRGRESSPGNTVQLGGVRRAQRPVFQRVAASSDVPGNTMTPGELAGQPILIVRVDGELYAVADRCSDTPLPLRFGNLDGHIIQCSWHGCRYDVRTGQRVSALDAAVRGTTAEGESGPPSAHVDGERLTVFPVREQNGEIMVAVGVEPVPSS